MKYKCFRCGEQKESNDVVLNMYINVETEKRDQIFETLFQEIICGWCYQEIIKPSKETPSGGKDK